MQLKLPNLAGLSDAGKNEVSQVGILMWAQRQDVMQVVDSICGAIEVHHAPAQRARREENAADWHQSNLHCSHIPLQRGTGTILKYRLVVAALVFVASSAAYAYDTGNLSCQNIGELAAQTMKAKQAGNSSEMQLAALTDTLSSDAQVERKLVTNIVNLIYQNELIVAMRPADAYMVFMRDCMNGKAQDSQRAERALP
jgi:hypothetical protein